MIPEALRQWVRERAEGRCEYCRMSQALQGATFHIGHIIPMSKGGASADENLALACPSCNLGKADATDAVDPDTGQHASLFNPRQDRWKEHFRIDGVRIVGMSPAGRATVWRLQMNAPRRSQIREAERLLGWWPPGADRQLPGYSGSV